MRNLLIVANWKANITEEEALVWLENFKNTYKLIEINWEEKEAIVCPSFPIIPFVKRYILENELPLACGAQDISIYGRGAYTGEVPGAILNKLANFCIVGHSERRQYFNENDEILKKKVEAALVVSTPIFCVQNEKTYIPEGVRIIAYEPVEAIGTGNPDTPDNAQNVAKSIKESHPEVQHVLYGGSVKPENVKGFTEMPDISGVLVGGASLDSTSFLEIIRSC